VKTTKKALPQTDEQKPKEKKRKKEQIKSDEEPAALKKKKAAEKNEIKIECKTNFRFDAVTYNPPYPAWRLFNKNFNNEYYRGDSGITDWFPGYVKRTDVGVICQDERRDERGSRLDKWERRYYYRKYELSY